MPIEWFADPADRFIRVRISDRAEESAYLALVRGVASVTNRTGNFDVLVDAAGLIHPPGYPTVVKIAQEVWTCRSSVPDRIAVIGGTSRVIFGKARQFVAIVVSLGLVADVFVDEDSALAWLGRRPSAGSGEAPTNKPFAP